MVDSFFRAGSLVFGGGHVVLPLLQAEVVPPGWVSHGGSSSPATALRRRSRGRCSRSPRTSARSWAPSPNGLAGASLALVAVFLPSFLLVVGVLPFWDALRRRPAFQSAVRGINAGVVGLLLAALYHPVWTSAIHGSADVALALAAFALLAFWRAPAWLVVVLAAGGGAGLSLLGW